MGAPLLSFSNVGTPSSFRTFPGFPVRSANDSFRLSPRGALRVALEPSDLVSICGPGAELLVVAFDRTGADALVSLGLSHDLDVSQACFDRAPLEGWTQQRGVSAKECPAARVVLAEDLVLKARVPCTIWLIAPSGSDQIISGKTARDVRVSVSRATERILLPEPLGEIRDEFTVTRGTARAYEIARGEILQIIDAEGQQCSDFMAFRTERLERSEEIAIDSTATRSMVRQTFPKPGLLDKFFDRDMRPMLQVVQDTCGRHDTLGLACTARGYEERGFPGHVNCSDNISDAMAPFGVKRRSAWPAINFFWNTWVDHGTDRIMTEESHSRPGDYVAMRALGDLVCVSTACPDDVDPINGWNPTDVHVRIYKPDTPVRRAIAYRAREDSAMTLSREGAFHPRISALTADLAPARDLWAPVSFPATGALGEYWACRERVTLQDMSGLRKYDVIGPDAEHLLQKLLTRDISRLAIWRGTYALLCDETGAVVDDGTLFRLAPDVFRWCCGSEQSARRIEALAAAEGYQVRLVDMSSTLVNVALQGPRSRDVLSSLIFTQPHVPALQQLKWFGVTVARLNDREGAPFMLSRTGYTGELGYEIFCTQADALSVWDALMAAGEGVGIAPMGSDALEMIRIEAGLAAGGAEFGPGHDAFEAGLGFAVDLRKPDFIGRDALSRNLEAPRRALRGLVFSGNDVPMAGATVFAGETQVGHITSATRSPMLKCGIAMARLAVEHAETELALEVGMMDGRMKRLPAKVVDIPFVDPKRERARA